MKRILTALLFVLLLPITARADDASKQAKIDELFRMMNLDKLMTQIMDSAMQQAKNAFGTTLTSEMDARTQRHFDVYMKKLSGLVTTQLGWEALEPDYVKIYSDNFTEAQIDDILAFYKTPTGKALLEKTPALTQQGMQLAQTRMIALQPQVKKLVEDTLREMEADQQQQTKAKATSNKKL